MWSTASSSGTPHYKTDTELLEQVQRRATKSDQRVGNQRVGNQRVLCYEEHLRELRWFSLEKAPGTPYCSLSIYEGGL